MPNCYSRLLDLKAEVQGSGSGTSNDTVLLRALERASRATEEFLSGRHFYSRIATLVLPEFAKSVSDKAGQLWLGYDIVSITSLKVDEDGDATYEVTLTNPTDYWTWPYNKLTHEPIVRLDLNPEGDQLSAWPCEKKSIELVGKVGFSEETESTGLTGTLDNASDTSLTTNSAADSLISPGDTLIQESEQMDVTAVSGTTVTVTRGINGTTAAAHAAAAISRRRFPREVEQATLIQAVRMFREVQTGFGGSVANAELAGYTFRSMYPAIRDLLRPFAKERSRLA